MFIFKNMIGHADFAKVGNALNALCPGLGLRQHRQQQGRQHTDDRDDHQHFHQRETGGAPMGYHEVHTWKSAWHMPWSFHGETPAFGNLRQRFLREIPARRVKFTQAARLKFIFTLRIEQLLGAGVVGFRHKDPGQPVQIAIIRRRWVHELVDGDDAVFFQHEHQQLRLDERAGEEQFA